MSAPNLCMDCHIAIPRGHARCDRCVTYEMAVRSRWRLAFSHAQFTGMWNARPLVGSYHHVSYSISLRAAAAEVGLLPLCTSIIRNLRPGART